MQILLISQSSPLQEALCATLEASPDITLERLVTLSQVQALLESHSPDLLLALLPLPAQEAMLLSQLLLKIPQHQPVIVAGEALPNPLWDTVSEFPYLHMTMDTLHKVVPQLRALSAASSPPPRNLRSQLLAAIATLTPTLFTEFELEPLLQRIIEEAVALIPEAEAGSLLLEEQGVFAFRGFVGYPPELGSVKIPPASAFIPRLRRGEMVHVHDIMQSNTGGLPADVAEALRRYGRVEEIRETLAAPLLRADAMIGYITVDSFKPGTQFTIYDQEALGYLAGIATIAIHNTQLLTAERTARALAETVSELGRQLVASLDVQKVFSQILDALFRLTPCDAADILFVEDGDAVIVQQRGRGEYSVEFSGRYDFRLNIQQTANLSQAARQRTPLLIGDTHTAPGWISWPQTAWIRSHIAAPFYLHQQLAGFLCVSSAQARGFSQQDCEILAALIPLVAIAIQNAGLFEKEHTARQLAETLQRIGAELSRTLDEEAIVSIMVESIAAITPYTTLVITQITDTEHLNTTHTHSASSAPPRTLETSRALQEFPLLHEVAATHGGAVIADAAQDPRWKTLAGISGGSVLLAPMHSQGRTTGVLLLNHAQTAFYKREHLRGLQSLADLLMIALTNARLFNEARAARQRAEDAYENLRRLDAMKSQFIQNVSHELRTPLAIVKGYLDLVLDVSFGFTLEPSMEQALKAMQTHTNRLTSLVESITTLENVETGQLERHPQPILPVFLRALQAIRQKAERQDLELITDLEPQLPQVNVDPQQLGLALWHLLDNAIKFNRPNGHVWLRAWTEGAEVRCTIRDDGIGIPREEQSRIFERFYQVDGSTKRRYEGMGLGLSIAREVLEKHGGRIWVSSEGPNTGATFTLALPIYHEGRTA